MQLGVRWRSGETPHRSVPEPLHAEIAAQEALHPEAESWTLTWLEGRPRCALDDAATVTLTASGEILVEDEPSDAAAVEADDDWLN